VVPRMRERLRKRRCQHWNREGGGESEEAEGFQLVTGYSLAKKVAASQGRKNAERRVLHEGEFESRSPSPQGWGPNPSQRVLTCARSSMSAAYFRMAIFLRSISSQTAC